MRATSGSAEVDVVTAPPYGGARPSRWRPLAASFPPAASFAPAAALLWPLCSFRWPPRSRSPFRLPEPRGAPHARVRAVDHWVMISLLQVTDA
jgi:hypothetical protein